MSDQDAIKALKKAHEKELDDLKAQNELDIEAFHEVSSSLSEKIFFIHFSFFKMVEDLEKELKEAKAGREDDHSGELDILQEKLDAPRPQGTKCQKYIE